MYRSDDFKSYLIENGVQILEPTNEWEVIRFEVNGNTSVIYKSNKGKLSYTGDSTEICQAYRNKEKFPIRKHKNRRLMKNKNHKINLLMKRDGLNCFYCGKILGSSEMTVEHILSRSCGGNNHISNLALCCKGCNVEAGHKSVVEKVKMREAKLTVNIS
tara:strand:+ start:932 stop:1408 length:477 start_codon:yes stop_codon:yes gene_type:complete